MPRISNAKIIEWGTPPEPEPTGWDAVRIALDGNPGVFANVGDFTIASARKVSAERLPSSAGYETRVVPRPDGKRADVWVRRTADDATAVETRAADDAPAADTETVDLNAPAKPRTAKRGGVV